jgi:hypothetical protein
LGTVRTRLLTSPGVWLGVRSPSLTPEA